MTQQCTTRATSLTRQAEALSQQWQKIMRGFGRQCRGQGTVFLRLVRQTEAQLLAHGSPLTTWLAEVHTLLAPEKRLRPAKHTRRLHDLEAARDAHRHLVRQSQRLTQGTKLRQGTMVKAYDLTMAPMPKGKSNCPVQCGRKTGIVSELATGFLFATRVPTGHPSDASDVLPLLDNVQQAIDRCTAPKRLQVHAVGGDRGLNDPVLRQALHGRHILTVGIPRTVAPIHPTPSPAEVLDIPNSSGFNRLRTPHQVHWACASG